MKRVLIKEVLNYKDKLGFPIELPEYKGYFIKWDHSETLKDNVIVPVGLIKDDNGNVHIEEIHRIKFISKEE